ncbi:hypothetical protein SAMN05443253_11215 [Bacillus sp. OK048]|nr:hypothetical protein SAMN05443253_11215 [Bacillus sp. OK048]
MIKTSVTGTKYTKIADYAVFLVYSMPVFFILGLVGLWCMGNYMFIRKRG